VRPPRPALALAIVGVLRALAALGCSASSELVGNGACDAFCAKVAGLHCSMAPTQETCVAQCLDEQARCPTTKSEVIRCASVDGAVACDSSTLAPHVVNCDAAVRALDQCLSLHPSTDAGAIDAPGPSGPPGPTNI
jgi:hypothetical protein